MGLKKLVVALAVLSLIASACGDDDDTPADAGVATDQEAVATDSDPESGDAAPAESDDEAAPESSQTADEPTVDEPMVEVEADPMRPVRIAAVAHAVCAWDAFWCTVESGIDAAKAALGVEVEIFGTDTWDPEGVAANIDQALATGPDAMMVTISDIDLFREPLQRAVDSGIPVIAYNSGQGPVVDGVNYLTYIGQDEFVAGEIAGRRLSEAGGTNAVCINQAVGATNLDRRCDGLEAGFNGSVQVLGIDGEDASTAQTTISDFYAANPDVDTFLTLGPNGANPFYGFVEEEGLGAGDILHATFDRTPEIEENIRGGLTLFATDQQPYLQGFGAVQTLTNVLRYGILPAAPVTSTGPGIVTAVDLGFDPDNERPVRIAAVAHAVCAWDAFWCVVEQGINTAVDQLGVEVEIFGTDTWDPEGVAANIDQALATGPDAMMVTISDIDLFREPLQRAVDSGIPVIAYNSGQGPVVDGVNYLTYLGQDEYLGGYLGAQRLIAAGGTSAVCINQAVGATNLDRRCAGMTGAFAEAGLSAEVLGIDGEDASTAQTTISDFYAANPDVDTFLTLGPNGANPFYGFTEEEGLGAGDIVHGTFDLTPEIIENIRGGLTLFGIDQQPFLQGYGGVTTLTLLLRQNIKPTTPVTPTGPGFVDSTNVDLVAALAGSYR